MEAASLFEDVEPDRGGIYQADHKQGLSWYVEWFDHAGRLLKRRLGTVKDLGRDEAAIYPYAAKAVDDYIKAQQVLWHEKLVADPDHLQEMVNMASFPREVVAREILRICARIAKEVNDETRNGRPGLQLFADRVGISGREIHRIIEDPRRITVGVDVVDKICCQFDMLFDDFIASALEWASQTGAWSDRPGVQDPWPWGYVPLKNDIGHGPI